MSKPKKLVKQVWAHFHHKEMKLTIACVLDCSHQGQCDDDVEHWEKKLDFSQWTLAEKIAGLKETGGWSQDELTALDETELNQKILWIMACDAKEEMNHE